MQAKKLYIHFWYLNSIRRVTVQHCILSRRHPQGIEISQEKHPTWYRSLVIPHLWCNKLFLLQCTYTLSPVINPGPYRIGHIHERLSQIVRARAY